jgi:hypothetical protein
MPDKVYVRVHGRSTNEPRVVVEGGPAGRLNLTALAIEAPVSALTIAPSASEPFSASLLINGVAADEPRSTASPHTLSNITIANGNQYFCDTFFTLEARFISFEIIS